MKISVDDSLADSCFHDLDRLVTCEMSKARGLSVRVFDTVVVFAIGAQEASRSGLVRLRYALAWP